MLSGKFVAANPSVMALISARSLYEFGESVVDALIAAIMVVVNLLPAAAAEPFQFPFMQRALLTALLVGCVCGILSCYVVLKRWSLLGDTISHAVLPGVAVAHLLGWPFFVGGLISGLATAMGIGMIERNTRIKEDAAMGLMLTGSFALGIVIISQIATSTHLLHILFGNVLGVRMPMLLLTLIVGLLTLSVVLLYYKAFLLYSFDPVQASVQGMNTAAIHYGLMFLLTLTIVASLETVGIILVVAMLITPGATAYLLAHSLSRMMLIAAASGMFSAVIGLYLSFVFNLASGGTIVLVSTTLFFVTFLLAPKHGVLGKWIRSRGKRQAASGGT